MIKKGSSVLKRRRSDKDESREIKSAPAIKRPASSGFLKKGPVKKSVDADDHHKDEDESELGADDDQDESNDLFKTSKLDSYELHFGNDVTDKVDSILAALAKNSWTTTTTETSQLPVVSLSVPAIENGDAPKLSIADSVDLRSEGVRARLLDPFKTLNVEFTKGKGDNGDLSKLQSAIYPLLSTYRDMLFTLQSHQNAAELRNAYLLHAVNHVFRTRDRILKNNEKLKSQDTDSVPPDQGFTRPRVLILAPFKNTALKIVNTLIKLSGTTQQENKSRFQNEFSIDKDEDTIDSRKPVILDHTTTFLMQNWDHVQHIFEHLNLIPTNPRDCDFSRIKSWYLDGRAKHFRQTILLSHYNTPEINALFNKQCKNISGRIKAAKAYSGSINDIVIHVPQVFQKINCQSLQQSDDARFAYFQDKVLKNLPGLSSEKKNILIFIPSYLDFVRIRNHFRNTDHLFGELCEYTAKSDVSRTRSNFFHEKLGIVLYTERFHFFRRYHIRGVHHLIFYGLPEHAHFYSELVNSIEKAPNVSCTVLFNKYDRMKLERVVGTARVSKMMEKETFLFA
ncbi:rRNA-binding ribosome biosynthesis protein utp25 [Blyttiomyces sp. JEL0837]|nr:rRNA-binding ribosome biosynthesis protein utp25 [Blyttiomyces sp. JEL0837]